MRQVHKLFNTSGTIAMYDYGMLSGFPPLGITYTNGRDSTHIEFPEEMEKYLARLDELNDSDERPHEEEE